MTVKRYVSPYAAGTESFRSMRDTRGRTVPDPDEGPFYVLASDHEAEVAALRERLAKFDALYDAASGMSRGVDWNKGTHAKAYRSKLVAAVAALKEKQL